MRLALFLAAVLVAFAVAAAAVAAPLAGDPRSMVLQPTDLPSGFERTKGRYVSNAQVNRESKVKKDYAKLGRLRGYEATFQKDTASGIASVVSTASTYRTAAGAHESLSITTSAVEATREVRFRRLALDGKLGDEARLYKSTTTQGKIKVDVFTLVWRSGSVLSSVIGGGVAGSAAPGAVVALARKQQARVAAG